MAGQETHEDVLKAINDKLAELEDLQLVNKLDIINVKNELDKSSLAGGPSAEDMEKISELRELVAKSDRLRKAERLASEIEEMKAQLDKIKKSDSASLRHDFEALSRELEALKGRVSSTEKKGVFQKDAKLPSADLQELRQRIGKLESVHPSDIDLEVPEEVREELSKINEKISALEKSKPSAAAGRMEKVDELSGRISSLIKSMEEQKERIEGIESTLSAPVPAPPESKGKGAKAPKGAGVPSVILNRLERLEKSVAGLRSAGPKAPAQDSGKLSSLEEDLSAIKAKVEGLAKTPSRAPAEDAKLSSLEDELSAMKEKIGGLEKRSGRTGASAKAAPDAGEMAELRERMGRIEAGLEKASKLAMTLKPIEMPAAPAAGKAPKELELKVRDLERAVGAGVGEGRFHELEKKMDDIREWLPEYIDAKVEKKLAEMEHKVGGKVKEMDELKKELIDSTIEQMLAQPSTVGKMLGEKMQKQVAQLSEKMQKLDGLVKPEDAKLTAIVQDIDEMKKDISGLRAAKPGRAAPQDRGEIKELEMEVKALSTRLGSLHHAAAAPQAAKAAPDSREMEDIRKEMSKIRDDMKRMKPPAKNEMEDMGIEVRALATKLDSMHSSLKNMETSGISGVLRDLEILKTKADWLESTIHKLDLEKIHARIDELESMVRSATQAGITSGPIILE